MKNFVRQLIYHLDEALPLDKKLARDNEAVHEETRRRTYYSPFRDFKRLDGYATKLPEWDTTTRTTSVGMQK
jgi:hypothetical protein